MRKWLNLQLNYLYSATVTGAVFQAQA